MLLKNIIAVMGILLCLTACESPADEMARRSAAAGKNSGGLAPDGQAVFRKYCVACHGADGKLGLNGAKDLSQSPLTLPERVSLVTKGKGMMTPFAEILSPEEIQAVAEYTTTFK